MSTVNLISDRCMLLTTENTSAIMDFGTLAPIIWEHILSFLDFRSLVSCCRVCKSWYALVKESPILWKEACRKFGLIIREDECRDSEYWKAYLRLIFERKEQIKEGQAFEISEIRNSGGRISAAAYYKGKIAIAFSSSPQRIEVWNRGVCEITINTDEMEPEYLKFDDKYIMAGFLNGFEIKWWDIVSRNCISLEKSDDDFQCFSFDFLAEYNIAVGGLANYISIWNFSSGNVVDRIYWGKEMYSTPTLKIFLVPQPGDEDVEKKVIRLLSVTNEELTAWKIKFIPRDMSREKMSVENDFYMNLARSCMIDDITQPKLHSLHFDGKRFYYAQCSTDVRENKIFVWHLDCNCCIHEYKVRTFMKNLLGIGEKYVAIHAENPETSEEFLIFFDRTSGTEVKVISFPSDICKEFHALKPVIIGETSWLDGLNGENDEGIIFLCVCEPNTLKAVKWISRTSVVT